MAIDLLAWYSISIHGFCITEFVGRLELKVAAVRRLLGGLQLRSTGLAVEIVASRALYIRCRRLGVTLIKEVAGRTAL
jgi:hypothetical protein